MKKNPMTIPITFQKALFPYQYVMRIIIHYHTNLKSSHDNQFG